MVRNRIAWLLIWLGSLVFFIFYQQWLAWLLLGGVLLVPLFSFLVSLPAMVTARLEAQAPERVTLSTPAELSFRCEGPFIVPQWGCRVRVTHTITGKVKRLRPGDKLPTDHCGALLCRLTRVRVYDFLGLFSLPLRCQREFQVLVEPTPVPIPHREDADAETVFAWKPKNGGFSENHELRLYAPGDSLRQIHWKLSAKTGKLIIREPMIPDPGRVLVRLELKGNPDETDRLLGRFLWLGQRLLEQSVPFELLCLTGEGVQCLRVDSPALLEQAVDLLLRSPPARTGSLLDRAEAASKQYDIGGEPDES